MTKPLVVSEAQVEALTLAMTLAPGVYARNRMFDLFSNASVQRARTRASVLRGIAAQAGRAIGFSVTREIARGSEPVFVLRYRIPSVRFVRVAELSAAELAAVRLLAARGAVSALPPSPEDRALVDASLARLLELEGIVPSADAVSPAAR